MRTEPFSLKAASLNHSGITHGFFGRRGGASRGLYASLNCGPGSGDALELVRENRRRVGAALGVQVLVNAHQIHSGTACEVDQPWALAHGPKADGMATRRRGLALAILTADCAPVLLADPEAGVIGAAHAGWRGALGGVLEATLARMQALGARTERICAAIGPAIGRANYEVGADFAAQFEAADAANRRFFSPAKRAQHFQFALEDYVAARLAAAGIGQIEPLHTCTYAGEAEFFSYRRNCHAGTSLYGRQISAIALL